MQLVRRTWVWTIRALLILIFISWASTLYLTYYISYNKGAVSGYNLGLQKADVSNPFRAYVEMGKPFCYDQGVTYTVKRGKKSYIPVF